MSEAPATNKGTRKGKNPPPPPAANPEPVPGTEPGAPPGLTVDNPELDEATLRAYDKIDTLEQKRRAINADIAAEREGLAARSLNLRAVEIARKFRSMNDDQRLGFDETFLICRRAIGQPVQGDLFGETALTLEAMIETDPDAAAAELLRLGAVLDKRRKRPAPVDTGETTH